MSNLTCWMNREEFKMIFFGAMRSGYASREAVVKNVLNDFPDSKQIVWTKGVWRVTDTYEGNLNDFTMGATRIYRGKHLVWAMQYLGRYDASVIPFLKTALRHNYEKDIFVGGRGPAHHEDEKAGYRYINDAQSTSLHHFHGYERIIDADQRVRGWHQYHGGYMY